MKQYIFWITLLALCPMLLIAQAPDTVWTKTIGGPDNDVGNAVLQTNDGGYIIAGSTESFGSGGLDGYIVRTDPNGDTIWTRCYGGSEDDELFDIKPTLDGNYIATGYSASEGNGSKDIWLVKIDTMGTPWSKTFYGANDEGAYSIQPTPDSAYVITGYMPYGFLDYTVFLLKIREYYGSWHIDWLKTYCHDPICPSDGNNVVQTIDGGYIIAADSRTPEGLGFLWIIKTDSFGEIQWDKKYVNFHGHGCSSGARILESIDGYVVAGFSECGSGYPGAFLLKTDTSGDSLWATVVYSGYFFCNSLQKTSDSGFIIAGSWYYNSDILVIKADANGDTLWTTLLGGIEGEQGYSAQQTSDNGYIVAGSTNSYGAGGDDVYLIKLEPDVSIQEQPTKPIEKGRILTSTIFSGPLLLPEGKTYKVFDITGREVKPHLLQPGIYFIEIDGVVTHKVVKVR